MNNLIINQSSLSNKFLEGTIWGVQVNDYYSMMVVWNIILLFAPFVLVFLLKKYLKKFGASSVTRKISILVMIILWLLFIPNAAYIITDVRHLLNYCPVDSLFSVCSNNAWMIMFFFIYSIAGWIGMVFAIRQMKESLVQIIGVNMTRIFVICLMPVLSLGVLLGLINRWNSWDLFMQTPLVLKSASIYFIDPLYIFNWLVFTVTYSFLYLIGDYFFKK